MAELRMTARATRLAAVARLRRRPIVISLIAIAAAGGCARGEAAGDPPAAAHASGVTAPKGWRAAPAIAKAAADAAKSDRIAIAGSEAWSQPAMGCYAVWLSLTGSASAIDAAATELVAALDKAGVATRDVIKPAAGERGTLALGFDKLPYRGKLRAELASTGAVTALACAWNQREPAACEGACVTLLGGSK